MFHIVTCGKKLVGKSQVYQLYATQGLLHFQANTTNPVSVPLCCCISVNRMEHIRLRVQKNKSKSSFRSMVQILIIFKSPVCLAEPAEPVTLDRCSSMKVEWNNNDLSETRIWINMNKASGKAVEGLKNIALICCLVMGQSCQGCQTETWQGPALQKAVATVDATLHACQIS